MPLFRTVTLGCKVNQYETEYVREGLLRLGYREAKPGEAADLCVVNTCTVTGEADLKSRKLIRQLGRQNPGAEIVVMGCYATRAADQLAELPGVVDVIPDKRRLPELLARLGLVDVPAGISAFGSRQRAYVKVQDGCRMPCAYCIIPKVRPVLASRPVAEVLSEVGRLVQAGYREIVLTGIHLGHYGIDLPGENGRPRHDLAGLVRYIVEMADVSTDFRVRISSIEAVEVTPALLHVMAEYPDRVCPHVHLSMQSGSDAVLTRMRRRWASERFAERCREICAKLDHPALTTDVIVGFPGETEADFEATCRAVEEVGFSKLHVFRYSARPGTEAANLPDQVSARVKGRRAAKLGEVGRRLRRRFLESLVGREMQILLETRADQPGLLLGTSGRYAPVAVASDANAIGQLVLARAIEMDNRRILAAMSESTP